MTDQEKSDELARNHGMIRDAVLITTHPAFQALYLALKPIGEAYSRDPGTSDLDNDQPVTIHLGDVRRAWQALDIANRLKARTKE